MDPETKPTKSGEPKERCAAGSYWPAEEGCTDDVAARGLCSKHYARARYQGKLDPQGPAAKTQKKPRRRKARKPAAPSANSHGPKANDVSIEGRLRRLIAALDDGLNVVLEIDGRQFVLAEVEITRLER